MITTSIGKAAPLSATGLGAALHELEVDKFALWSLLTVETQGFGFLSDRRPKILFERHIFHQRTKGVFSNAHPDISSQFSGNYAGGAAEYGRLERAMRLDQQAALESTSWGLGQIMGFNAPELLYRSTAEMISRFRDGEDAQLDGIKRFILHNESLARAFRTNDWKHFAFLYNGNNYARNNYHTKLATYYELYKTVGEPSIEVRSAQAQLSYLGFDPHGVDGVLGNGTRTALLAFQKARELPQSAKLDAETLVALSELSGISHASVQHANRAFERKLSPEEFSRLQQALADMGGASNEYSPELQAARHRGKEMQKAMWLAENMVPADRVRSINPSLAESDEALQHRGFLAVPHPDEPHRLAYPAWQFEPAFSQDTGMLMEQLEPLNPWAKLHFFLTPSPVLLELTPQEIMQHVQESGRREKPTDMRYSTVLSRHDGWLRAIAAAANHHVRGKE